MPSTSSFAVVSIATVMLLAAAGSSGSAATMPAQEEGAVEATEGVRIEVLDAETGEAIPSARVSRVPEAVAPVWGEFWSNASELTDADGLAVLPPTQPDEQAVWLIVQAEGYAPLGEVGFPGAGDHTTTVRLEPAVPAKVRVLDFRGEPVPLVYLGQCVGCGHTPDVLGAFTDHEGRATLTLVGKSGGDIADVFPVGHGVRTSGLFVPWSEAMKAEVDLIVDPGYTVSGRVIGTDGLPVAGVAVGTSETHRGPWAVTDHSGRFQLFGVAPGGATELEIRALTGQRLGFFGESRAGVERVLRLGSDLGSDERTGAKAKLTLTLDVVGYEQEGKGFWQDLIPIKVWDPMTGWMMVAGARPGVPLELELLPGSYVAEIGGADSPFASEIIGPVSVLQDSATSLVRALPSIEPRELRVMDVGEATGIELFHSVGTREPIAFDRYEDSEGARTGIIEHHVAPYTPAGIWVALEGKDSRKVPFALEPYDRYSLDALVARRR